MNRPRLPALAVLVAALAVAVGCSSKPTTEPDSGGSRDRGDPNTPGGADDAKDKAEAAARLKQIGLAMHNYHDALGQFPAGVVGPKGEVGLSWRVQILPYLEGDDAKEANALYQQFNLKEPWDGEHNKKLVAKMPNVFASPGKETEATAGKTYLRSFAGDQGFVRMPFRDPRQKGKAPPPFPNVQPGMPAPGQRIVGITDGSSNTLAVAEAAEPVEWTKPDELPFHGYMPGNPARLPPAMPKLGGVFAGGFHGLMCDGAVRFFPGTLKDETLAALISTYGGEVNTQEAADVLNPPKPKGAEPATAVPDSLPDAAARKTAVANLQKVVLGLHAHHDTMGYMPAGVVGPKPGAVGLSWRVAILPFIGEEKLFKEFKLTEAWDSEHNKALLAKMPAVFASPGKRADEGHTFVRTTMGPGGIIRTVPQNPPPKGKEAPPPRIEVNPNYNPGQIAPGRRINDFQDGTSNTILVVEAGEATPWTKPDELFLPMLMPDPRTGLPSKEAKLPPLGGVFADGFHAGLADGRIAFFKADYPTGELAKLFGPTDGQVTDPLDDPKKVPYVVGAVPQAPAGKPAGKTQVKP